jgi:Protein of unknown function (DUF3082)
MPDLTPPSEIVTPPSPPRCIAGSLVAGGMSYVFYNMTSAIALSFANKPVQYHTVATANIAVAVRTLVVGMSALGAGVFGLAALGLFGLGIQTWLGRSKNSVNS